MTQTIVVTDHDFPDLSIESSVLADSDVELRGEYARTPDEVVDAARGADGLPVQYAEITPAVFEALPDVRAIGRYGIGVDSIDLEAASEHGVQVVNVPDYCVEEVPTHTFALLLACVRRSRATTQRSKTGSGTGPPASRSAASPDRRLVSSASGNSRVG